MGHEHHCNNNAKIERDGKFYCGKHDPVAIKERDNKNRQKYNVEAAKRVTNILKLNMFNTLINKLSLIETFTKDEQVKILVRETLDEYNKRVKEIEAQYKI